MKVLIDLEVLSLFNERLAICDIENTLSYRQNLRYVHRYEEYGLLEIKEFVRSKGKGAPKIIYELTPFGTNFLKHFTSLELQDSEVKKT